jgi:prepilin-type N-terminal cleavage/methylation domain-containing protein
MQRISMKDHETQRGFSLVEMAVVMLILGLLLGGLFTSIGQSTDNKRRTDTLNQLALVEEALYGFAQAYGRLPCPSTVASAGVEAPLGGGACTATFGFVPVVTLGLPDVPSANGLMLDAWRNPLRYSVSALVSPSAGNRAFTSAVGLAAQFPVALAAGTPLFCVGDTAGCSAGGYAGTLFANTVPAVIHSGGSMDFTAITADEAENLGGVLGGIAVASDIEFVNRTYTDDAYDDLISWISAPVLYSRLVQAGRLP